MKQHFQLFENRLCGHYPLNEIHCLFQWSVEYLTGWNYTQFSLSRNEILPSEIGYQLNQILERLITNEPIQYILGETEFCSLSFLVNKDVLIPRPETEELVDWIVQVTPQNQLQILDIGTGSGCIAIALKKKNPAWQVSACDLSEKALSVAMQNAKKNAVDISFCRMDILQATWKEPLDLIVSNPPYVCYSEKTAMSANVLDFEPHLALFVSDNDPLVFYKAIIRFSQKYLRKNGTLFFEINRAYGKEMMELLYKEGFVNVQLKPDLSGNDRMIMATKK